MQVNQPTRKLRLFHKIAIALFVFACNLTRTAYALPGQPIKSTLQWAQNHPILPKLSYHTDSGSYFGETNFEGGMLGFTISFTYRTGAVRAERLTYRRDNQGLTFTKTNLEALRLLERIYDRTIADDLRDSQYVTQVGSDNFYRGRKFAYIAHTGEYQALTLIRLEDLAGWIRDTRYCQTHVCDL
jgi:hypothetical protein